LLGLLLYAGPAFAQQDKQAVALLRKAIVARLNWQDCIGQHLSEFLNSGERAETIVAASLGACLAEQQTWGNAMQREFAEPPAIPSPAQQRSIDIAIQDARREKYEQSLSWIVGARSAARQHK
jgi:hypothetical protein